MQFSQQSDCHSHWRQNCEVSFIGHVQHLCVCGLATRSSYCKLHGTVNTGMSYDFPQALRIFWQSRGANKWLQALLMFLSLANPRQMLYIYPEIAAALLEYRLSPMSGIRIGEATNTGPPRECNGARSRALAALSALGITCTASEVVPPSATHLLEPGRETTGTDPHEETMEIIPPGAAAVVSDPRARCTSRWSAQSLH